MTSVSAAQPRHDRPIAADVARRCDELFSVADAATLQSVHRAVLDSLACAIAGRNEEGISILRRVAVDGHGPAEAHVFGSAERVGAETAALANGMMISVLLYDDSHLGMGGHPSGPVLPAVLAAGELTGASLDAAWRAFVVGYELECRLGAALSPTHYEAGWHSTGSVGVFGAAAAAGLLLGLTQEQLARAFAIAASTSGGLRANFGSMTMSLHSGDAAAAGLRAARLAKAGFTANADVFSGPIGFGEVVSESWDGARFAAGLASWGKPFAIDTGAIYKFVPCGTPTVPVIDAVAAICAEHRITADDVESVQCDVSFMYPRTLIHRRPTTGLAGKTSLEYCVAATLVDGLPNLSSFTDEAVSRPAIARLVERVRVVVPPHLTESVAEVKRAPFSQPVRVVIRTKDGRDYEHTVRDFKGTPANPGTRQDHMRKLADALAGSGRIEDIVACVEGPGGSVADLMSLLSGIK